MKRPTCSYVTNPFSKPIIDRTMPHRDTRTNIIDWPISMDSASPRIETTRRWTGGALNRSRDKTGMTASWDRGTSTRRLFSTDGSRASRTTADEGRGHPHSTAIHDETEPPHLIPILRRRETVATKHHIPAQQ